jgi:hypothetical protein
MISTYLNSFASQLVDNLVLMYRFFRAIGE